MPHRQLIATMSPRNRSSLVKLERLCISKLDGRCQHDVSRYRTSVDIHLLLTFTLLCLCHTTTANVDRCEQPQLDSNTVSVKETDPQGTILFRLPAGGNVTWTFNGINAQQLLSYFDFVKRVNDYTMSLTKPLDLETINLKEVPNESLFDLSLLCRESNDTQPISYIVHLNIVPVNEYAPTFDQPVIEVNVNETDRFPVDIVRLADHVQDLDRDPNSGQKIRSINFLPPENAQSVTEEYLGIKAQDGTVFTRKAINYESLPADEKFFSIDVIARDPEGKNATATLIVRISDVDDLPPRFLPPGTGCRNPPCSLQHYTVSVLPDDLGPVTDIKPGQIKAIDGDSLNYPIQYSVTQGPPNFSTFIVIDQTTGQLTIIKELSGLNQPQFSLTIEATEDSTRRRTSSARILFNLGSQGGVGSVRSGTAAPDEMRTLSIVLGVLALLALVALVLAVVCFRKRYNKPVHPDDRDISDDTAKTDHGPNEKVDSMENSHESRPRKLQLSREEPMKIEEEMATWLSIDHVKDIVDLSDEDTLRWRKKNGVPPKGTQLNSRDSAFEESDKKSVSEESRQDHEFSLETEYAEVGYPLREKDELEQYHTSEENIYSKDPTQRATKDAMTTDSGVEEHEYLTPETARLKRLSPFVVYNKAFQTDDNHQRTAPNTERALDNGGQETLSMGISSPGVKSNGDPFETHGTDATKGSLNSRKTQRKSDRKKTPSVRANQGLADSEDEVTEYSTPKSNRSSLIEEDDLSKSAARKTDELRVSDEDEARPAVPPRPKVRPVSGLAVRDEESHHEGHYARVNKKKKSKSDEVINPKTSPCDQLRDGDHNTGVKSEAQTLQAPQRRKRPRKRTPTKQIQTPEDEDVYDGTKDYADLEIDPSFYTDTNKAKIKRSSRIPVMQPDPNDTRYWITVSNDY